MDVEIIIERHEQQIKSLESEMTTIKEVQSDIRSMNETLVMLANEIKHTSEHLSRHERKIEEMDSTPKRKSEQIETSIISALVGCILSLIIGMLFV